MTEKRGRRGQGRIFQRGRVWWIRYSVRGKRYEESSESGRQKDARDLLRQRLGEVGLGIHKPAAERVTFEDLADMVEADYKLNGRKAVRQLKCAFGHLRETFGTFRAIDITAASLKAYAARRMDEGRAAPATIVCELAALKRGFSLAVKDHRLIQRPEFPTIELNNARSGFFEAAEFEAVVKELGADPETHRAGHPELVALLTFAYLTGWRVRSEILPLRWSQVDLDAGIVRLEPGTTKNREGRTFPVNALPELANLLRERRKVTTETEKRIGAVIPWVFHREGKPIRSFSDAWTRACNRAGLAGMIPHDLRRTAVRNLERAGVPRSVAMQIVGHKTERIYRRYAITNERDLAEGVAKLAGLRETATKAARTVLPIGVRGQLGDSTGTVVNG